VNFEEWLSIVVFLLFAIYGFSNVYIVIYLRRHAGLALDLLGFFSVYAGDVKNYKKLNRMFSVSYQERGTSPVVGKCISLAHLWTPVVIVGLFLAGIVLAVVQPLI
jgi:hypothetical protein